MLLSSFPVFKVTGEGRRQRRAWVVRLRTSFFIQSERFTQFLFLTTVFSCLGFHRHNKRWGEKEREKGLRVILRHSSVKPLHRTATGRVGGSGSAGSLIGARLFASTSPGGQSSADHYLSDTRLWKEKKVWKSHFRWQCASMICRGRQSRLTPTREISRQRKRVRGTRACVCKFARACACACVFVCVYMCGCEGDRSFVKGFLKTSSKLCLFLTFQESLLLMMWPSLWRRLLSLKLLPLIAWAMNSFEHEPWRWTSHEGIEHHSYLLMARIRMEVCKL